MLKSKIIFYILLFVGSGKHMHANNILKPKQTVIFDLGGVLITEAETNLHKANNKTLKLLLNNDLSKTKIFNRAFEFAALFYDYDCKKAWILGDISSQEIIMKIKNNIDKINYDYFFNNDHERQLIKHGIEFVLLSDLLVELTEIIVEGLEFIKKCQKNNINLAIISNWDPESFKILKDKFSELFIFFENKNIIIPQIIRATKPSPEIYNYAIKQINCDPKNCFFIDDSLANVEGAKQVGIKAIHHKNWETTKQEIKNLGLTLNL